MFQELKQMILKAFDPRSESKIHLVVNLRLCGDDPGARGKLTSCSSTIQSTHIHLFASVSRFQICHPILLLNDSPRHNRNILNCISRTLQMYENNFQAAANGAQLVLRGLTEIIFYSFQQLLYQILLDFFLLYYI